MRFETKKLKNFFKKIPRILAERFLLTSFFLSILAFLIGFLIFKTSSSFKEEIHLKIETFNKDLYQRVLEQFKEKERKFEEIDQKVYLNPFEEK